MNFIEACKAIHIGKKVRHPSFAKDELYCMCRNGIIVKCIGAPFDIAFELKMSHFLSEDWYVVSNPMTFAQAIEAIKSGKRVFRRSWIPYRTIRASCEDGRLIDENHHAITVRIDDIEAADWEVSE